MGRRGSVGGFWERGVLRGHWFGDKDQDYHPHLNFLVEGGYVSRQEL